MNCLLFCLTLGIGYSVPTDEHLEPVGVFSAQVHYKNFFLEGNYYDESTWTMQGQNAGSVSKSSYFGGYSWAVGSGGFVDIAAGYTDIDLSINEGNIHENVTAGLRKDRGCIRCGAKPAEWYYWQNGATILLCMYHYKMTFNLEYKGIPWVHDALHGPDRYTPDSHLV